MSNILIVEDDEFHTEFLQRELRTHSIMPGQTTYTMMSSGREALFEIIENPTKYDFLITDQQLGENRNFWGSEIAQRIRHRVEKAATMRIILMSSEDQSEDKLQYVDAFIKKDPWVDLDQLKDVLATFAGQASFEEAA